MAEPAETYKSLMETIRARVDTIEALRNVDADGFLRAETAAFHGRKIIEGIAFACLIAIERGLNEVPKDAKGHWNAETILKRLKKKGIKVLPSPSELREATPSEKRQMGIKALLAGVESRRLDHAELVRIYRSLHEWLHELNPYTRQGQDDFLGQREEALWDDLARVRLFVWRHIISIGGKAFYCVLCDKDDGQTKVLQLERPGP